MKVRVVSGLIRDESGYAVAVRAQLVNLETGNVVFQTEADRLPNGTLPFVQVGLLLRGEVRKQGYELVGEE